MQLLSFGVSVMTDIDPNADNFMSAGIIYTEQNLVGCLSRLVPNKLTKVQLTLLALFILLVKQVQTLLTRGASGYSSPLGNLSVCVCVCVCVCISGQAESTPSVQNSSIPQYVGFI